MLDSSRYNQNMSERMKGIIDTYSEIAKTPIIDVETCALIVNIFTKYIYSYMNNTAVLQFGCHRDDPLSVCVCVI